MTEAEYDEMMILKERGVKKEELEVSENEIDDALALIDEDQKEIIEKPKEPEKQPEISIDDITRVALESYKDIQKHSEEIYDAFYGDIVTGRKRDDVSKQMLTDSQRIKIESINALASLANAKARLIAAQNRSNQGNVGVFINSQKGEDVGINLANLSD